MFEMLTYGFMQKAFITGIPIVIACSLLGTFLILRRLSLIGDGIAHISFGGIATGLLFNLTPFFSAFIFAIIGALGIQKLRTKTSVHEETAIGIISHISLGLGIFIISAAKGFNVDILSYLFGSILSIKNSEMITSIITSIIVILFVIIFYNELFHISFNEESAKVSGIKVNLINTILILLTAVTIVSSMNVVGLLLASSMMIIPAASALQLKTSFKKTLISSTIFSTISMILGLIISYQFDFAASGTIVLINAIIFGITVIISRIKNKNI